MVVGCCLYQVTFFVEVWMLCVGVGTLLGLGWQSSCCLVCHVVGCLGQSVVPFVWMLVMG